MLDQTHAYCAKTLSLKSQESGRTPSIAKMPTPLPNNVPLALLCRLIPTKDNGTDTA
jgi:hypothetical protein